MAKNSAREFLGIHNKFPSLFSDDKFTWHPPPPNVYKVNCDASLFYDDGVAGYGCILRNSEGFFLLKLVWVEFRVGAFFGLSSLLFGEALFYLGSVVLNLLSARQIVLMSTFFGLTFKSIIMLLIGKISELLLKP
ncbi:hypothetical protein PIB30_029492 [Stylosanthes scabra]|uniref:RNase H type-1 domain-containing protein n=1 Tax=Stylosanthes scabra TaxID=79078 RepID=A0ABU6SBH0_9FABA|nr:hypothetical protein [Stylosanthes scabra]